MRMGEKVVVRRLMNGLYRVESPNVEEVYIGGAASTAFILSRLVFKDEASGDMLGATGAKAG